MSNNELVAIMDDEQIYEFRYREQAEELMKTHSLRVFDWEIVEIGV